MNKEQTKLLNDYFEYLELVGLKRGHRKSNIVQYFNYLQECNIEMYRIKYADAEEYHRYLVSLKDESGNVKYAYTTVINKICDLRIFYDFLLNNDRVFSNPFKDVKRNKQNKTLPRNILNEENLGKFLTRLSDFNNFDNLRQKKKYYRMHVIAELMYSTGARINEVLKLQEKDVDLINGTVILRDDKTSKERIGFLNSYVCSVLKIYMEMRNYYFIDERCNSKLLFYGTKAVSRRFNKYLNDLLKKMKLGEFKSHNLRHAFGCHMLNAGCDIRYIQEFLGHERLMTTQIYTKISKENLKKVLDSFHPRKFGVKNNEKN